MVSERGIQATMVTQTVEVYHYRTRHSSLRQPRLIEEPGTSRSGKPALDVLNDGTAPLHQREIKTGEPSSSH